MSTRHFLFTDIEGSTRLWEAHPTAMREALARHDDLVRSAIESNGGVLFKHTGDGLAAVFNSAADALAAAAAAQRSLSDVAFADVSQLKVRMAVHSGSADERDGDFFGPTLNRAARLLSAAHGGQVLTSLVSARLASDALPDGLSLRALGEHRLLDLSLPEDVHQLMIRDLVSDFPPLRTPDVVPNNLPVMGTSFVGRHQESMEVEKLIRGARMVTLTGVGGAGKTRTAVHVAAALGEEFDDGVWLVELAPLADPALVVDAVAEAVGVPEQPGVPLLDALLGHLHHRSALVIMDNCEHMIPAAAGTANTILQAAPEIRILATSREVLGVPGEVTYGLRSMSFPEPRNDSELIELRRHDAVQLFLERAAAAKPEFRLTAGNAEAVGSICRRLDGIPLAIELAAARLRSFTPAELADHLDDRFRVLTRGTTTALPRQQTLAAAIEWSYRLLEGRERQLFERLSVFRGGFDMDAARSVCSDEGVDGSDILELLPVLVDKSLVQADAGSTTTRYRLLESIRHFAQDKLDKAGKTDTIQRRHAEYFLSLALQAEPHIRGDQEKEWWDRLDAELDNLRLATEWSRKAGEPELGLRLVSAFWRFWWFTFRFSQGITWLKEMYDARGEASGVPLAKTMLGLGSLSGFVNDRETAVTMLERSVDLFRELRAAGADLSQMGGDFASALINLSYNTGYRDQNYELVEALNTEALDVARSIGAETLVPLGNLAEVAARRGDVEAARAGFAEAISEARKSKSVHHIVEQMIDGAKLEDYLGEPARAATMLDEAIAQASSGGLSQYEDYLSAYRALIGLDLGEPDARPKYIAHARNLFSEDEFTNRIDLHTLLALARADFERAAGDHHRSATALGILEATEEESGPLFFFHEPRRSRITDELSRAITQEALAEEREHGRTMSPQERIEFLTEG